MINTLNSAYYQQPTGLALLPIAFTWIKQPTHGCLTCYVCLQVTHGALTPVDVVKTRMQLSPEVYNKGMLDACKQVVRTEGAGALLTGFGPTFAGYFLQGALKFGG